MAKLEHIQIGEVVEFDDEIPFFHIYGVEPFDEDTGEPVIEDRVTYDGEEFRVLDDGVDMVTL